MDQIYRIDEKHCLIIYAQGSLVLALHTPVYRNARPHILVNDCLHGLTSAMFDHRIYFAYVNIKNEMAFGCCGSPECFVLAETGETAAQFEQLQLDVFNQELYLFFQTWNPVRSCWELQCRCPLKDENARLIDSGYKVPALVTFFDFGEQRYIIPDAEKNTGMIRAFRSDENGSFLPCTLAGPKDFESIRCAAGCLVMEMEEKMNQIVCLSEEKQMCQAQIDRLSDRLEKKEKEICRLSQCLECTQAHHEKQLMDIKAQYDTLADNAVKLQKAARIWRDKYFSRT